MKVRTGNAPRAADLGDHFALFDILTGMNKIDLIVSVDRDYTIAVAYDHYVPVAADLITVNNLAFFDHTNRAALGAGNIDAVMKP